MSGLTTPKGGKTNTTTEVKEVPAYAQAAQQNLLSTANNITSPWTNQQTSTTAPVNSDQAASYDLLRQLAASSTSSLGTPATFDASAYLAANPDVAAAAQAAGGNASDFATNHYNDYGQYEGREKTTSGGTTGTNRTVSTSKASDLTQPNLIDYTENNSWQAPASTWQTSAEGYDANTYTGQGYTGNTYNADNYAAQTYAADNYDAERMAASTVGGKEIQELLNPYTSSVVDTTTAKMRKSYDESQAAFGAKAAASGAYGGSRAAVAQAAMDSDYQTNVADTTAKLMSQGWDTATSTALANAKATQDAASRNQAAGNEASQFNATANNQAGQFNAGAQNTALANNAAANNAAKTFNATSLNDASRFSADASNTSNRFNADAWNTSDRFGADARNSANNINAAAQNSREEANAARGSTQLQAANSNALQLYQQAMTGVNQDNNAALQSASIEEALRSGDFSRQLQAIAALGTAGDAERSIYQSSLDTPLKYLSALSGTVPQQYGSTGTTTAPNTAASPLQTLIGLGTTLATAGLKK